MEKKHKEIIQSRYNMTKKIIVLDIPDEYEYMHPELVQMIETTVNSYFE